jgi:Methylamine utilisation protein MauE
MNWVVGTWCLRLLVGAILIASAGGKSLDLQGFVDILITYQLFPGSMLWLTALGITALEWVLGVWILSGWRLETGALIAMSLNGLYALGLIVTLGRGLDLPTCGCYGVFFPQPLRWYSPFEDLVLVGMCYALRVGAQQRRMTLDKVPESA